MMMTYYVGILFLWNLLTFVMYALDKRRAIKNQWRISEKMLLFMSLCLGGFGALLAGKLLRHKTKKWYFVVSWYVGVALTVLVTYLLWRIK